MSELAWRPGVKFSRPAIAALIAEWRRGDISDRDGVAYLRGALQEADRLGATEVANQILPMLAVACQVTGALAEALRLHRRRVRYDPSSEAVKLFITVLANKGFFRTALRCEQKAKVLGILDGTRERLFRDAVALSACEVGPSLSIHHTSRVRVQIPDAWKATSSLNERGEQARDVAPYVIPWAGDGNDLLNARRWCTELRDAGGNAVAFLDAARRLAHRVDGVVFDPTNRVLRASASRFFVARQIGRRASNARQ